MLYFIILTGIFIDVLMATGFDRSMFEDLRRKEYLYPIKADSDSSRYTLDLLVNNETGEIVGKKLEREQDRANFDWFYNHFNRTSSKIKPNISMKTNDYSITTENNSNDDLKRTLGELAESVDKLAEIIKNKMIIYKDTVRTGSTPMKNLPDDFVKLRNSFEYRRKRDANESETTNVHIVASNGTNDKHTIETKLNETNLKTNFSDCPKIKSGRRSMLGNPEVSPIKDKLLHYLDEGFNEIQEKVNALEGLKQAFKTVDNFRIGYIVANIDTLAANMRNLRGDVARNRNVWGDSEILNVYDRLKVCNSIVTNLSDIVRIYAEKSG